jgi:predicted pyridoxine 5'-phosphate oxidase superfamily flavin-nucleotide-binding protein
MTQRYLEIAVTPSVARAQSAAYGAAMDFGAGADGDAPGERDSLGDAEARFIAARDSFYIASVSETGWPYMQHRGGPKGFLRVADPKTLVFADFRGNRQLLSAGNVAANDRVALFLMDYPGRRRLKILGRARFLDPAAHPDLAAQAALPGSRARIERIVRIDVEAYDWNCPQHITPRYTADEVDAAMTPLRDRVAALEKRLRDAGIDPGR